MLLRDSFTSHAIYANMERNQLIRELAMVNEALEPLQEQIDQCKMHANRTASKYAFGFFAVIGLQFTAFQYGTYIAFSWDIIEPFTACISLLDACAAYYFWLIAGRPWDINAVR